MNIQKELLLPSFKKLDFHAGTSERHGTYYEIPAHKGVFVNIFLSQSDHNKSEPLLVFELT